MHSAGAPSQEPGCGWWDSNPHGPRPRALRVPCVCQFRHTRTAIRQLATAGSSDAARQRTLPLAEGQDAGGLGSGDNQFSAARGRNVAEGERTAQNSSRCNGPVIALAIRYQAGVVSCLRPPRAGTGTSIAVPADGLGDRLRALYDHRARDRVLYLKADAELRFGRVQQAVEIARASGVRVVAAVTEQRSTAGGSSRRSR